MAISTEKLTSMYPDITGYFYQCDTPYDYITSHLPHEITDLVLAADSDYEGHILQWQGRDDDEVQQQFVLIQADLTIAGYTQIHSNVEVPE